MTDHPIEEVDGFSYRFRKMNAFDQLHVGRRLAPMLSGLGKLSDISLDAAFAPIAEAISRLKDEDVDYVLQKCLASVDRKLPGGQFVAVWNKQGNRSQFEDLDLGTLLKLTGKCLEVNLSGFLGGTALSVISEQLPT